MDLRRSYIPTLHGVRLTDTPEGFAFPDGTLVPDSQRDEVIYLAKDESELSPENDLFQLLASVGAPPVDELEVEAGFFHRTLHQWLAYDPLEPGAAAPLWDYDCWKADVSRDGVHDGNAAFRAHLYRGERDEPEEYRYWVALHDDGRIQASGWLSAPPDLLGGNDEFSAQPDLSSETISRLLED